MVRRKTKIAIISLLFAVAPILAMAAPAAWNQTDYWFRDDDGSESSATGYGTPNTVKNTNITSVVSGNNFRLRFGLKLTNANAAISPQVEFKPGSDCLSGAWTKITSTSSPFTLRLSPNFNDGDVTTKQIVSGGFNAGKILESSNPSPSISVNKNRSTEAEWSLTATDALAPGVTYAFRVTNNGTMLDTYSNCPLLTASAAGTTAVVRLTLIRFFGKAFPNAQITLLRKIGEEEQPLQQTTVASEAGDFGIIFEGNLFGRQAYGIRVMDKDGRVAPVKFYDLDINLYSVTDQDIFSPPTLGLTAPIVPRGGAATLDGYATPGSSIETELDGKIMRQSPAAGAGGYYRIAVDAADLTLGPHTVRTRQVDNHLNRISDWSVLTSFSVSPLAYPKTDLNSDGIINISDWSIFLSLWKQGSEDKKKLDLNGDGQTDIKDFSLFISTFKKP